MNVTSAIKSNKEASNNIKQDNCCENITNSVSTFNQRLANISNKLGLSKAIYQK